MNTATSLIRIAILLVLGTLAINLLIGEEMDETETLWLLHLILDKAIGLSLGYAYVRLYGRWVKTDPWLSRFEAWNNKEAIEEK